MSGEDAFPTDGSLEGRVALVTGAASGIGRASAHAFARAGARVVVSDVQTDGGEATAASIRKGGGEAIFVSADVTEPEAVSGLVERTLAAYERLDCAHNCAGVGAGEAQTHAYPEAQWDRVIAVNLKGTWLAMREEIEVMLRQEGGTIVNTSSTLGLRGSAFVSPYAASKHGVLGLTRTAAIEYAPMGIRVNAVCPGAIDTPMMDETFARFDGFREQLISFVPLGRLGSAEEVAAAVVWLSSDAASFVTGQALGVEGGLLTR